jgi:UDP-glucose 4-epimerase
VTIPDEMLAQLRYGRGVDNRKIKASGYRFRYTTREAVLRFRETLRLAPMLQHAQEGYRYEREVEEFLRYSPSVGTPTSSRDCATSRPEITQKALQRSHLRLTPPRLNRRDRASVSCPQAN